MPNTRVNGIRIEYETYGAPSDPALLLTIGLGCQLIYWDEPLCRRLAESGLFVIRYDNRDTGLSTRFDDAGEPDMEAIMKALMQGKSANTAYTLNDMVDDAAGLLDALGIEKAHICGMSMGANIAMDFAVRYPARTLSLIPIYGSSGDPGLPGPDPEAMNIFFEPIPDEKDAFVERLVRDFKILAGSGFPFDEPWHRDLAARAFDRGYYPEGTSRNLAAVITAGSRKAALASVTVPALVIHGTEDPIVPVDASHDIAAAIPDAELMIIDGMGHDVPHDGPWFQIIERMMAFTAKQKKCIE
ncbi:MAG: alpha/beta hydrolase [Desulfobacterales bacterium]